jgi:DNA-directed RNA polymerase beta subunit
MTIGLLIEIMCGVKILSASKLHRVTVGQVYRLDDPEWDNPEDEEIVTEKKKRWPPSHPLSQLRKKERREIERAELLSKGESQKFQPYDATPFRKGFSIREICRELKALGINQFCEERVTNGQTGEVIPTLIFKGFCFYQRLKHMVIDKYHARSRGGKTRLTRQPREGRKLGGGLRSGFEKNRSGG